MKSFNFLQVVVALLLMVTVVSCTTLRDTYEDDGYYSDTRRTNAANRIYVDDPYQGTIVLERDAYTGRYFQVNPVGIGSRFGSPFFNDGFGRGYYNGYRNRGHFNNGGWRQGPIRQQQQQPSVEQRQQSEKQGQDARRRILGGNN